METAKEKELVSKKRINNGWQYGKRRHNSLWQAIQRKVIQTNNKFGALEEEQKRENKQERTEKVPQKGKDKEDKDKGVILVSTRINTKEWVKETFEEQIQKNHQGDKSKVESHNGNNGDSSKGQRENTAQGARTWVKRA